MEDFKLKSLSNVANILNLFTVVTSELGVMDISRRLNMDKSTVHRVLSSLENAGLVQKTNKQKYTVGLKILELANIMYRRFDLETSTHSHLLKLRDLTNETTGLHIRSGKNRFLVCFFESSQELKSTYTTIGAPLPLHLGSAGKVILAFMPQKSISQILYNLSSEEIEEIYKNLEQIRKQKYWFASGERREGISSISAPIFNPKGEVIGSINISGPSFRLTREKSEKFKNYLFKASEEISKSTSLIYI